jgi:hypothetical protein
MGARDTSPTPELPEILRSPQLAAILTPLLWEMAGHAEIRYNEAQLSRVMAAPLAAIRAMINDIRRTHGLAAIDPRTGEPIDASPSDNGAAVVAWIGGDEDHAAAEAKS